jgi:hypothetical protein
MMRDHTSADDTIATVNYGRLNIEWEVIVVEVVVWASHLENHIFDNIDDVIDTEDGKLILMRKKETVAVFNVNSWTLWRTPSQ